MSFSLIPLANFGVYAIKSDLKQDERGSLHRIWQSGEKNLNFECSQVSIVSNPEKFTLRGLHFQTGTFAETKIVFCTSGKVFDVGVDLNPDSDSYLKNINLEIGPGCEFQGVYFPRGFAHGYLTLEQNCDLVYLMDRPHDSNHSSGILWSDRSLQIPWPRKPMKISKKDMAWPVVPN